jgi:hypothetical protein
MLCLYCTRLLLPGRDEPTKVSFLSVEWALCKLSLFRHVYGGVLNKDILKRTESEHTETESFSQNSESCGHKA